MQALLPRRDHHITRCKPFHHLHKPWSACAQPHGGALGHLAALFRASHHSQHIRRCTIGNDSLLRHHIGVRAFAKHRRDACKHAGAQLQAAVVDAAAHGERAAIGIDLRVDGQHHGRILHAWQRIKGHAGRLAGFHLVLQPLGQAEVHIHRVQVFHVDDVGAILEVVAHVHAANACNAIKRSHDAQALGCGFGQGELGFSHFEIGGTFVHRTLADEPLGHQLLVALVVGTGDRQLGTALLHLGAGQLVVELHQQLPLAHALPIAEIELRDAPADFRPQHHAAPRTQAAHSLGIVAHGHLAHLGRFHHHGFCRALRTGLGCCVALRCGGTGASRPRRRLKPPGGD